MRTTPEQQLGVALLRLPGGGVLLLDDPLAQDTARALTNGGDCATLEAENFLAWLHPYWALRVDPEERLDLVAELRAREFILADEADGLRSLTDSSSELDPETAADLLDPQDPFPSLTAVLDPGDLLDRNERAQNSVRFLRALLSASLPAQAVEALSTPQRYEGLLLATPTAVLARVGSFMRTSLQGALDVLMECLAVRSRFLKRHRAENDAAPRARILAARVDPDRAPPRPRASTTARAA